MTTSSASDLSTLAARVEAGSGEDRALDNAIARSLDWWGFESHRWFTDWPRYTSSLDAVVALIAERLPGWFTHIIQRAFDNKWSVELSHPTDDECSAQSAFCTTEVRARLSCFLRALAAQQDRQTEGE